MQGCTVEREARNYHTSFEVKMQLCLLNFDLLESEPVRKGRRGLLHRKRRRPLESFHLFFILRPASALHTAVKSTTKYTWILARPRCNLRSYSDTKRPPDSALSENRRR